MAREPILSSIAGNSQRKFLRTRDIRTQDDQTMEKEVNVLALVKGEERFIFLFDDENRDETLRQLARFAANPELDFSWYDAAMLSRKIRETVVVDDEVSASSEFDSLSIDDFV
ncbi:MAG TPA: hypothetical protein DDX19_19395 [Rhodopirellula baltica]|uniref:Uncharacterized protein n=5 Tax=Pirellulaceae TaxID=2691357 RepID=Q7UQY5_RHOBA|nr:hypothetical protein RBWH47_01517 [Rhodopirellula baltica WH47]ELP35990.1 hypothetical protein RBSWK_00054 [Rhodopirellula baltica SWK14]EMB18815.1 hypothetical protein RE6C_00448 [Rhodopirellula europaea 6C]CAD74557.1 hypothetical protein RB6002 [Rhodopirellula baltica SH 1]HBE64873.1 hypothetical protein [Rhodopirellula baltica]